MEDAGTLSGPGNLRRKIVSVAAGESHTLALTGDGRVHSWGRGAFGRLGTGSEADELFPVPIKFNSAEKSDSERVKFVGIAAGAYHSVALADDGTVWCWGYNIYGQLGFSGENSLVPRLLELFGLGSPGSLTDGSEMKSKTPLKVKSVKARGMMSLAIDNLGGLWLWGNIPESSSPDKGEFSLVSNFTPVPVWDFHGHTVVKVACGYEHIVALVSHGETYKGRDLVCYSWGNNAHGQLGLGDTEIRLRPEVVKTFNHVSLWEVYEVACGAFHTALLTHRKGPSETLESICWTFGQGDNEQLGHGTTQSISSPEPVKDLPEHRFLVSVDCGLFHTSVVSSAGEVWSWGMEKGLGLCPDARFTGTDAGDGDAASPLLYGSKFREPVQVACGAAHTVLVTDDGYKLWSWGRGRSGVLGNGKTEDCYTPSTVLWPPLTEDFKELELGNTSREKKIESKDPEEVTEMEKKLSMATEETKFLRSKLSTMEIYASLLHGSIFAKPFEEHDIPFSLQNSGIFSIAKEWESMLESADRNELVRLEVFYRNMLAGVKDKIMKRRIQEIIKECLPPPATGS